MVESTPPLQRYLQQNSSIGKPVHPFMHSNLLDKRPPPPSTHTHAFPSRRFHLKILIHNEEDPSTGPELASMRELAP